MSAFDDKFTMPHAAFVMPATDTKLHADGSTDWFPADENCMDSCMYLVFGWNHTDQCWQEIGQTEIRQEAYSIAREWHERICAALSMNCYA